MKNLILTFIVLTTIIPSSCRHRRHVIIATHTDNSDIRLEYEGMLSISDDGTKIKSISHNGYIDYKRNRDDLHISEDQSGHINYEMNGADMAKLDNAGQSMLDEAIRMIIKSNH